MNDCVTAAVPPLRVIVPSNVVPDMKVTVPVGVPALEVTLAVKVMPCPDIEGFCDDTRVVVVNARITC